MSDKQISTLYQILCRPQMGSSVNVVATSSWNCYNSGLPPKWNGSNTTSTYKTSLIGYDLSYPDSDISVKSKSLHKDDNVSVKSKSLHKDDNVSVKSEVSHKLTYRELIEQICKDFHTKYTMCNTVHKITDMLNELPIEEKENNRKHLKEIRDTIKSYNFTGLAYRDAWMSSKQISTLYQILRRSQSSSSTNYSSCYNELSDTYKASFQRNDKSQSGNTISVKSKTHHQTVVEVVVKLDKEDFIYEIITTLITNLKRNVLSSALNLFVKEYFDSIQMIMEDDENVEKYHPIVFDIQECLERAKWICTNNGGFQTEPNRIEILEGLHAIVTKYFE